jgi:hypothetical protein
MGQVYDIDGADKCLQNFSWKAEGNIFGAVLPSRGLENNIKMVAVGRDA